MPVPDPDPTPPSRRVPSRRKGGAGFFRVAVLFLLAAMAGYYLSEQMGWRLWRDGEVSREFETMRTYARILIPAGSGARVSGKEAADAAEAAVRRVNDLMGPHGDLSDVARLNASPAGVWVEVDPLTWRVVMEALRWNRLSGGAFDPTIGPIKSLFKFDQSEHDNWPDAAALDSARKRTGADKLLFDREGMRLSWAVDGMRLDLGAIAKGFAADQAAEALMAVGARHGVAEIGGELRVFGGKPGNPPQPWRTGIRDPRQRPDPEDPAGAGLAEVLELTDGGVATSGDYESYFIYQGKRFQHIIDPGSGLPVEVKPGSVAGVTVISPDSCAAADALATTLCVLGPERGRRFLEGQALGLFSRGVRIIMFVVGNEAGDMRRLAFTADDKGNVTMSEEGKDG